MAIWLVRDATMNLIAWHFIKETCQGHPSLNVIPTSLPDKSVALLNGLQVKHFEYSLQIPWHDAQAKEEGKSVALWQLNGGAALMLFNPLLENNNVKLMRGATDEDTKKITRILGAHALSSNYDFMAAELAAAPSQVKWWSTLTMKARSLTLLNLKSMEVLESITRIYPQSSGEMHGFQMGDPALPPYKVELYLYDRNDRRYQIWIVGKELTHQVITQAEINGMVASLRPIPHS